MARILFSDLIVNFTISATSTPTTETTVAANITNYYKQAYDIFYGVGNYATPDTDVSDPLNLIRSEEFVGLIITEIQNKVQQWHDSGMSSEGELIKMPNMIISDKIAKKMKKMLDRINSGTRISSIRVWGSEYDDAGVI